MSESRSSTVALTVALSFELPGQRPYLGLRCCCSQLQWWSMPGIEPATSAMPLSSWRDAAGRLTPRGGAGFLPVPEVFPLKMNPGCYRERGFDYFMMSGGNILALQKLLGQHDIKVTQKYAHLAPDHLAAEAARVSFRPKPRKEGKVFALGDVKSAFDLRSSGHKSASAPPCVPGRAGWLARLSQKGRRRCPRSRRDRREGLRIARRQPTAVLRAGPPSSVGTPP